MREAGIQPVASRLPEEHRRADFTELRIRQARRGFGPAIEKKAPAARLTFDLYTASLTEAQAREEANRCLQCDLFCNICVTVCPNRANVALRTAPVTYPLIHASLEGNRTRLRRIGTAGVRQPFQVVNIADFCNACGNCETFCPTSGAPYRDKYRVHLSRKSFEAYGTGVHFTSATRMAAMIDGMSAVFDTGEKGIIYEDAEIRLTFDPASLDVTEVVWKADAAEKDVRPISETAILYRMLKEWLTGLKPQAEG